MKVHALISSDNFTLILSTPPKILSSIKTTMPSPAVNYICFILLQVLKKSFKAMSKWLMSLPGMSFFKNQQQTEKTLQGNKAIEVRTNSN